MITFHWTQFVSVLVALLIGLVAGIWWRSPEVVRAHWAHGAAGAVLFLVGLLAGVFWNLPYDQASNLVGLVAGLILSIFSIGVTVWSITRSQEPRLAEIQREVTGTRESIGTVYTLMTHIVRPVMANITGVQYGTSAQPISQERVGQERSEPAPSGQPPAPPATPLGTGDIP